MRGRKPDCACSPRPRGALHCPACVSEQAVRGSLGPRDTLGSPDRLPLRTPTLLKLAARTTAAAPGLPTPRPAPVMNDGSLDFRPSVDGKRRDPRPDGRTVDRTDPLDFEGGTDGEAVALVEDDFTGEPPDCRGERDDHDLREGGQGSRLAQYEHRPSLVGALEPEPADVTPRDHGASGKSSSPSMGPCGPRCAQSRSNTAFSAGDSSRSLPLSVSGSMTTLRAARRAEGWGRRA